MGRTTLRALTQRDRAELVSLVRKSRAVHRPWISPPADDDAFDDYLLRTRQDDFKAMVVCRKEDGALVGAFNLSQIFYGGFRSAYLSYWVGAPYAQQGYMAEGLEQMLRFIFRTLRLHRVEANIQPANEASKALVRRAGFQKEGLSPRYLKIGGRWRDHERWALTVEDWRARR